MRLPSGTRPTKYFLGCALAIGACSGLGASKARWNYFFSPPAVRVAKDLRVASIAFAYFRGEEPPYELPVAEGLLDRELRRCAAGDDDCTFGRTLLRTATSEWRGLVKAAPTERPPSPVLSTISQKPPSFSLAEGHPPLVTIVELRDANGHQSSLVSVMTHQVEGDDDHHGYAEWLLTSDGKVADFAEYYFDVAGVEFLTPAVLVLMGMMLSAAIASFCRLLAGAIREVLTDAWR